jgi:hypothetical protein
MLMFNFMLSKQCCLDGIEFDIILLKKMCTRIRIGIHIMCLSWYSTVFAW